MDFSFKSLINVILHLNDYIGMLVNEYHILAYLILMLIIFSETGLVVAFFLPGDSLLFATGIVFAAARLPVWPIILLLILAAFAGDNTNYWIGRKLGRKLFVTFPRIFKIEYLEKTEKFYVKYGVKAILLSRYVPFFRTCIPFFAGLSKMAYPTYMLFSFLSAALWVNVLLNVSYYFGNIPFIKKNFSVVILGIILLSMIPAAIHFIKEKWYRAK